MIEPSFVATPGTHIIHIGHASFFREIGGVELPMIETYCGKTMPKIHMPESTLDGWNMCIDCCKFSNELPAIRRKAAPPRLKITRRR
jgi:hypothetical protein